MRVRRDISRSSNLRILGSNFRALLYDEGLVEPTDIVYGKTPKSALTSLKMRNTRKWTKGTIVIETKTFSNLWIKL